MKSTREIFYKLKLLSKKWEHYFDVYDKILLPYIGKRPKLLEIGVAHGGSIEMWLKYFENDVVIYAVDANKDFLGYKFDNAEVHYSCVHQGQSDNWEAFLRDKNGFDIIIDDGSHDSSDQIFTLHTLFPHLNDGGIYVIEDTHTSYWTEWGGGLHKQGTLIEYMKNIPDILHVPWINHKAPAVATEIYKNIKSIAFYDSMVVIEKGPTAPKVEAVSSKYKNPNFEWN
jgi:hypothetical protein